MGGGNKMSDRKGIKENDELESGAQPAENKVENEPAVPMSIRLDHVTFANYNITMATGGIALLLSAQPNTFNGLVTIGKVVYIFDIVLFLLITSLIVRRFIRHPHMFMKALKNNTEGLFVAAFFLSLPSIIGGMQDYGAESVGPWLLVVIRILFWIYAALSFLLAVVQYWYLFTASRLTVQGMTPAWLLPIFPVMLAGTLSSIIAGSQPASHALPILVAGVTFQGLGFWTAIVMYSVYITRLMEFGLPAPNLRPGMFISVGPPSFTGLALIGMSEVIPSGYAYFVAHPTAAEALQQTALAFAIFIWSFAFWFFCVSFLSCITAASKMSFHLIWWAFIFPVTGFCISIIAIGRALHSTAIGWIGSVMSAMIVAMYLFVLAAEIRAFIRGDIMWPGKDEDKDE